MKHREYLINCDSTEDMLWSIQQANIKLDKDPRLKEDLSIFSMDAEALFPSLDLNNILEGVWTLIMESDLQFNNIDYKEVCKYLTVVCDKDTFKKHNLLSVIPKKQTDLDGTSRREPTLAFLDTETYTRVKDGISEKYVPKWNWTGVKAPTRLPGKRLVALALMEVIRTTL